MSVVTYYKGLPPWAKGAAVCFALVAGYYGVRSGVNLVDKLLKKGEARKSVRAAQDELDSLAHGGVHPTMTRAQALAFADALEQQYEGCDVNGWNAALGAIIPVAAAIPMASNSGKLTYAIFDKLKNDADFLLLVDAFNVRTYDQCGPRVMTGDFTGTLYKAIADELNNNERRTLNAILKDKRITYQV